MVKNIPFRMHLLRILTVIVVSIVSKDIIISLIIISFLFLSNILRYRFYENSGEYIVGEIFTTFTAIISVIILKDNISLLVPSLFFNALAYHKIISYYILKEKIESQKYNKYTIETLKLIYTKNLGHINSENSFFNTSLIILLTILITSINLMTTKSIDLNIDKLVRVTNIKDINYSSVIDLRSGISLLNGIVTENIYLAFLILVFIITFIYYLFKKIETRLYEKQCKILENEINTRK